MRKFVLYKKPTKGSLPEGVEFGGIWYNESTKTYVGITYDIDEYHVPELKDAAGNLTVLTKTELRDYIVGLEIKDPEGNLKTNAQKRQEVIHVLNKWRVDTSEI